MTKLMKGSLNKNLVPGSRVPITYLLDYLKSGLSISDFVAAYPWVKKTNVEKAINEIKSRDFASANVL